VACLALKAALILTSGESFWCKILAFGMTLKTGSRLGPYEISAAIGAGGMGEVYRARDTQLGRVVAIKVLPSFLSADPDRLRRFEQEARAAAALNHPNILVVFQLGTHDGVPYLVSELLEGSTLREPLQRGALPIRKAIDCGVQIARGLAAAHEKGIVHRDLKPENVFVTKDGRMKILDFGLARLLPQRGDAEVNAPTLSDLTDPGTVMGTVGYMSPEQVSGKPADHRADIFAFGAILYEMLTGKRAFQKPTSAETMTAILNEDPPGVSQLVPLAPPALQRVVHRCLEKNPEQRFQSASDLAFALEALSDSSAVAAPAPALPQRESRSKRGATVAGLIIVVLLAGAALILFRTRKSPSPSATEYLQLTNFADSAVAPELSPDGRMLAFIRGPSTFVGHGEVYIKLLPDGEPVQLTHDGLAKMGPLAFSPDGSRIAYTVDIADSWTVPVLGGEPSHWLKVGTPSWIAAAGGQPRIMFSALTGDGIHMGVFTATESRADQRPVYLPNDVNGMAHRSYLAPDGRSVLTVEMDVSSWLPCRLVPFDGSAPGQRVGPQPSQCTDAAWSPDGKWMYFSADTGDGFHIWRQSYPDGTPEQVTFGATEEQGVSFAPDGRSFVTSIGEKQSTIWLHDLLGDRQITSQGYAFLPSFSPDGKRLYYLQRSHASRSFVSGELWTVDLQTGARQRLLPEFLMEHYSLAADGQSIVFIAIDDAGHSPAWIAPLDGSSPPRKLTSLDCVRALFGAQNDLYFVGGETTAVSFLYHVNTDGSALRRVVPNQVVFLYDVSPDGKWIALWEQSAVVLYSSDGATRKVVCDHCASAGGEDRGVTPPTVKWSSDGKRLYLHENATRHGVELPNTTYEIPLRPGWMAMLPASGFPSIDAAATALGKRLALGDRVFPSPDPVVYAFPRLSSHRNIFRVQVQ
jgi:eukaryotic-like serine/threonine-protein kinase